MEERAAVAGEVTELLHAWRAGDQGAFSRLVELVHPELRRIASAHMRRLRSGWTLDPQAIVGELFLRMCGGVAVDWRDRNHFLAVASIVTRQVLVGHARRRSARKRDATLVTLHPESAAAPSSPVDIVALDAALDKLAARHPRHAQVVELRFFGGLSVPEVALHLGVGSATVERDWRFARAWLYRELTV